MLKGKAPQTIQKRLKVFIYGPPKVGKTTCSIQFPSPYLIDTEGGAVHDQYVALLEKSQGAVFQCSEIDDVITEIKTLRVEPHPYKTFILDSVTILYNNLINYLIPLTKDKFGEPYNSANRKFLPLLYTLMELDMNVIVTAHSKPNYVSVGGGGKLKMEVDGETFDCHKKIPFLFDLIIEVQNRGGARIGIVKGSRLTNFKEGENFSFNYQSFREKYDVEIMERDTIPEKLCSTEQVIQLESLIKLLKISEEVTANWLNRAKVTTFCEMREGDILKCIEHLKSQLPK